MLKHVYCIFILLCACSANYAQDKPKTDIEFYATVWLTTDYNFQSSDPNWFEMLRPTKILDDNGQPYNANGIYSIGVRPSRFGFKGTQPTEKGDIKFQFDFDLVGGGPNVGQTFFRVFNAYAEWNRITIGQRNSVFMDGSVVPNTVDFFGPNGMVLLRNVQLSYKAIESDKQELVIGLENPSATSDLGQYGDDFEYSTRLENMRFIRKAPALTAHYRRNFKKGHLQVGVVGKHVAWDDGDKSVSQDLSGSDWGYGTNITGSYHVVPALRLVGAFITGKGIQNFINDGTDDIGVQRNYSNNFQPIVGKAIPFWSMMAFAEITWNSRFTSALGFSTLRNQTFDTQLSTAYEYGNYATVNVMYRPVNQLSFGLEYQYASRQNTDFIGDPVFGIPAAQGNSFAINKIQAMIVFRLSTK